ncbi:MAG: glutathione S-transferase family protein [Caldimonas sp.]
MKIYSGPLSMFGAKVEIAAREKGVEFDLVMVPFDFERGYAPKHPEVVRINPKHQVPVLVDGGLEIFDSTQILEYLEDRCPEPPLWPRSIAARAEARQLELWSDEVFFPPVVRLMGLRGNPDPVEAPEWKRARAEIEAHYLRMNQLLSDREYMAHQFSFADIAFYMAQFFAARHTVPLTSEHSNVAAWRERVIQRRAVATVVTAMADYLRSQGRPVPELGGKTA